MKFGFRVPSIKKRVAARLSVKRVVRHSLGLKMPRGLGILSSPKKALYNKVYNKTTFGTEDIFKAPASTSSNPSKQPVTQADQKEAGQVIRSSSKALTVTDENFAELREEISSMHQKREELARQLELETTKLHFLTVGMVLSYVVIVGFFNTRVKDWRMKQKAKVSDVKAAYDDAFVKLTFANNDQLEKSWLNVVDAFHELQKCQKIWDLTYSEDVDRVQKRTTAQMSIKRTPLTFRDSALDFIHCDVQSLHFANYNGPDIYLYPTFLVLYKDRSQLGIFDLKTKPFVFTNANFHEVESVPSDSEVIDHTWAKTNKDGSRDKRFAGNYQIPVVRYGKLDIHTENGLDESYMFSNYGAFDDFEKAIEEHYRTL